MLSELLRWGVLGGAALSLIYYLVAIFSARRFFLGGGEPWRAGTGDEGSGVGEKFSPRPLAPGPCSFAPPVSILKPVHGVDQEAYANFASFCRQDYPEYEILFGVRDADDPVVPIIQKLIQDFPRSSIRLLIGSSRAGSNDKVAKLCRLAQEARYELLVVSDSDVRVAPDYLSTVVAPFRDSQVGAVTCLYSGMGAKTLGDELEAVSLSSDFFAGVVVARQLEGVKFALGATMAIPRQRLAEIGGFEAIADCFSDDFELGNRIAARKYRVELLPYAVSMVPPSQMLLEFVKHQLRWSIGLRHSRPWGHFGLLLTQGLPWALAAAAVSRSASVAAGFLGAYLALRLTMAWTVGVWGLKDPLLRRKLWLVLLWDAIAFFIWLASFVRSRIRWRGAEFYVHKGRLIPVPSRPGGDKVV